MHVPKTLWLEVLQNVAYLINRIPSRMLAFKKPFGWKSYKLLHILWIGFLLICFPIKLLLCFSFPHQLCSLFSPKTFVVFSLFIYSNMIAPNWILKHLNVSSWITLWITKRKSVIIHFSKSDSCLGMWLSLIPFIFSFQNTFLQGESSNEELLSMSQVLIHSSVFSWILVVLQERKLQKKIWRRIQEIRRTMTKIQIPISLAKNLIWIHHLKKVYFLLILTLFMMILIFSLLLKGCSVLYSTSFV